MPDQGCAVVTGGTRGIGAAIAARLREDGWTVAILARSEEADVRADVGDADAVHAAFAEIRERFGAPLVLVNNAGHTDDTLTIRMGLDQWRAVLQTNLDGAFLCTKEVLSPMMRGRWGRIVNISSVVAERANPGQPNYAAAKAGLLALTRTVAKEMARKGVTCNAITPGLIETDMTADVAEGWLGLVPAGRAGRPEEVAAAVAFLCSEEAAYINGATLAIDGGLGA
ncbi:MAG TPA: SDR family oxidoreductase [Solirubrobacteraceae bacterium]|nr:SDR family oxidoreductase [Solirubrobacteraceae bacterium]